MKRKQDRPENIIPIITEAFELTNNELLNSEINTDLSGSTVVATFIYDDTLYCFNVGDSRAILISKVSNEWKFKPLSDDQKPSRED
jgi:serine/threonine protein phosphatase PrpC